LKKVLILEDEEPLGLMYKKRLEKDGFEVVWTKTSQEIEDKINSFNADIVLLDHGLHGESRSGLDVLPTIKQVLPKAYVFMLTNYSPADIKQKSLQSGADGYLVKIETSPAQLGGKLREMIA